VEPARPVPVQPPAGARIEYAPADTDFTALVFPQRPFPFFPDNYLTSQPSYQADGTGQMRVIEVHGRSTVCPPDVTVVARVSDAEVERMQQEEPDQTRMIHEGRPESSGSNDQ
jgi:hypothetical protein